MGFKCILNAFIRCVFAKCTKNIFIANYEIVCMLLVKNETKGWKNTVFCQFYEIVCILLVKPYTLEQPKQNYTVVERSTFSSWWAVCLRNGFDMAEIWHGRDGVQDVNV